MKKGKGLLILMGGKPPKGMSDDEGKDKDSYDDDESVTMKDIARDLIEALKDEDVDAVAEALEAAHMCAMDDDDDEEETPSDESNKTDVKKSY